jgi:plastocyanin
MRKVVGGALGALVVVVVCLSVVPWSARVGAQEPPASGPPKPQAEAPRADGSGPVGSSTGATIRGRVMVKKKVTPPAAIAMAKANAPICGALYDPGSLSVNGDGTLQGCVVYVKGPKAPAGWDRSGTYTMDQKACHYTPRVLIVPVGGTVTFTSSDPTLHNVRTEYRSFNQGVTIGSPQSLVCTEPAFAPLECSVHGFMHGLLVVAENPWYALTDAKGSFVLTGVPAGSWTIYARHEELGKNTRSGTLVKVPEKGEVSVDLVFE